jgi:hypothetical protein
VTFGAAGPLIGSASVPDFETTGWVALPDVATIDNLVEHDLSVEAWVYHVAAGAQRIVFCDDVFTLTTDSTAPSRVRFAYDTAGSGPAPAVLSSGSISNGAWHHVVGVRAWDAGKMRVYIDGALDNEASFDRAPTGPLRANYTISGSTAAWDGRLAHVAIYDTALSSERIAAHFAAGMDGIPQGFTGSHADTVLDAVGWPAALAALDTGNSTIAAQDPSGNALDYILAVAEDTEAGLLQVRGDGVIDFTQRHAFWQSPLHTSQVTFGEEGAETGYADLRIRYDDQDIYSTVAVTPFEGGTVKATDATSKTRYGPRTLDRSTKLATDLEAVDQANGLLQRYKDELLRVESIVLVGGQSTDARYTQMLSRVLGDRVTVQRKPPGGGEISADVRIESVTHAIAVDKAWTTTFGIVPVEPQQYWLLGNVPHGDDLGTDSVLGW